MKRVAMIAQKNYEQAGLEKSLRRAIELCGFDLSRVSSARVLLKPNMLGAYPPEMGVTTNPDFVATVGLIFKAAGALVSVGDSPNGIYPTDDVWNVTGIRAACKRSGLAENIFEGSGSEQRDGIMIARAVLDADIIINLPKFKTHGLTILTLAAKNLFGCINGMQKTAIHRECRRIEDFAHVVACLSDVVRPALTIIDGIVAMDGNGPSAGDLKNLGVIVAGTDVHTIDAACCRFIGLDPKKLDTLAAAAKLGLWDMNEKSEIVGDPIEAISPQKFELPATYTKGMRDWWIARFVIARIWSSLRARPEINERQCKRCLLCIDACPVAAINQKDILNAPKIDKHACIECFCCHEICPHRAIALKRSAGLKIARWLSERSRNA